MRFTLIDRIDELVLGERIVAHKCLSMAEEYLDDHFPRFPVMPGVLMLETMTQAAAWLIRASEDFAHSVVVLKEVRNVKFADFVRPGQVLRVTAEILKHGAKETQLKAQGTVDGEPAVSGRLILGRFNQSESNPVRAALDEYTKRELRKQFRLIYDSDAGGESGH